MAAINSPRQHCRDRRQTIVCLALARGPRQLFAPVQKSLRTRGSSSAVSGILRIRTPLQLEAVDILTVVLAQACLRIDRQRVNATSQSNCLQGDPE